MHALSDLPEASDIQQADVSAVSADNLRVLQSRHHPAHGLGRKSQVVGDILARHRQVELMVDLIVPPQARLEVKQERRDSLCGIDTFGTQLLPGELPTHQGQNARLQAGDLSGQSGNVPIGDDTDAAGSEQQRVEMVPFGVHGVESQQFSGEVKAVHVLMAAPVDGVGLDAAAAHSIDSRETVAGAKEVAACRQQATVPDDCMQPVEVSLLQFGRPAPLLQCAKSAGMA